MLFLLFLKMCWWCEVWRGCLVWPPFLLRKMGWYQRHPETCFKQCCRTVVAGKVGEHFPLICFPANPPPPGQGKSTRHTWDSQKVIVRRLYKSQQLMFLDIPFAFSNMTHPGFVIPNLQDPCLEGQLKAYGTLHPSSLKTNMRPWKSTNLETEIYGNSSWKTSMLGQKMRKRRKIWLQKLPFVQFHQAENGQGLVPWGLSNAGAPRFTNRNSADFIEAWKWRKKIRERYMWDDTINLRVVCLFFFYKMYLYNLWNMSYLPGYLHDMLICIHICPQFHTYIYNIYILIHRVFHANAYVYIYSFYF